MCWTYRDHGEDCVHHPGADGGVDGLSHPRSLKDPSRVVKDLKMVRKAELTIGGRVMTGRPDREVLKISGSS